LKNRTMQDAARSISGTLRHSSRVQLAREARRKRSLTSTGLLSSGSLAQSGEDG
jgi:hypothetical protein